MEWEVRAICTFIGANAGMWMDLKKGQKNPIMEAAMELSVLPPATTREPEEWEKMRGEKVADRIEDDPRFFPKKEDRTDTVTMNDGQVLPRWLVEGDDAAADNVSSSYEALMAGWNMSSHGRSFDVRPASG